MDYEYFIGIDVSKDTFDIALIDANRNLISQKKFTTNIIGFKDFSFLIDKYNKVASIICLESTGSYHITLLSFLLENGYKVCVANPLLVKSFIKSISLRKTKNDKKDAFSISLFIRQNCNNLYLSDISDLHNLKPLLRERNDLIKNASRIKTQIKGILNQLFPELDNNYDVFGKTIIKLLSVFPSAKSLAGSGEDFFKQVLGNASEKNKSIQKLKQIKVLSNNSIGIDNKALELVLLSKIELLLFLKDKVSKLNKLIDDNIKPNNKLQSDIDILSSVDGIGDSSAKSFMIELGNINNFDNSKKLSAFIGIDPSVKQSGTSIEVHGNISKRGNSKLRNIIYHMAIGVSLYNKIFKDYMNKKRLEGKTFKQSIIAVANKLLRTILSMLKNKKRFSYDLYGV